MGLVNKALESRFEGRLFTHEGHLCFVVEVDREADVARVSYRADGERQLVQMPISEVCLRLASSSKLALDGLSSDEKRHRVVQKTDGWYFDSRNGLNGPFPNETEADDALSAHILAAQSN